MELVDILLDTNIALYFLAGDKKLAELLNNASIHLSFITELELLSYPDLADNEKKEIQSFIDDCVTVDINRCIKKNAVVIHQESKLKLPDAIIAGTSISEQLTLLSADKDFERVSDLHLFSYEL